MLNISPSIAAPANSQRKKAVKLFLFSLFTALLFQLICSKSSPLYPTNDWVDINCFFTTGKSILNGKVLYRDIYEQKGPLLYFLYAIMAFFSDTSFFGVFLVHVVSAGLYLFFSARIVQTIRNNDFLTYASIPVLAVVTHTSFAFVHGGSVEELSLWTLSATLYFLVRAILEDRLLHMGECFAIGLFTGFSLYIKFTTLGFFLGIALFVLIFYLRKKSGVLLLKSIAVFFGGIAVISIPVFVYFGIHKAIPDLFQVYFYNNLFLYSAPTVYESIPVLGKIITILGRVKNCVLRNPAFVVLIVMSFLWLMLRKPFNLYLFLMPALSFALLIIGTFWGRNYAYYSLILAPFAAFGFCVFNFKKTPRIAPTVCALLVILLGLSFGLSKNIYLMRYEKEDLPSYRFAEQINRVENATLLNYGFLDGGFYHAAQIEPSTRFFCTLNIDLQEMKDEQNAAVQEGKVDFVVTRDAELESPNYQCIDSTEFMFENKMCTYYLYQKTDTLS